MRMIFAICWIVAGTYCHAGDTLMCKNQVWFEFAGNAFADPNHNTTGDGGFYSVCYARNVVGSKSTFKWIVGIGTVKSKVIDPSTNQFTPRMNLSVPVGLLYRRGYKTSGFWFGLVSTFDVGGIVYTVERGHSGGYCYHDISFQFIPNIMYELKDKSERFIIQFKYTPKILASSFSTTYGDEEYIFPFWGGISLGVGW